MEELIGLLVKQVNVNESQAKGGAGLLFKLAKDKLASGDFSKIASAVGGVDELIKSAPKAGGASKLLGSLASAAGGDKLGGLGQLASLAGGLKSLNLSGDTLSRFIPVILGFVQGRGGSAVKDILASVLKV
ncbi:MAG TPA: DUF2780 domain-containing protein [Kiritimatiellia bacterium]|nr:DUF2780 domain-containing protein [Kiritimatiellia bacterium]HNS80857.1 DUF2780 domain-containing protein [Kiritimatiellia bacterium]HQQ05000.1 DUF2780 domain-containing protein [Kiritimatiellia bacterium]